MCGDMLLDDTLLPIRVRAFPYCGDDGRCEPSSTGRLLTRPEFCGPDQLGAEFEYSFIGMHYGYILWFLYQVLLLLLAPHHQMGLHILEDKRPDDDKMRDLTC